MTRASHALSLFDSSDYPADGSKKNSSNVVALGPSAARTPPTRNGSSGSSNAASREAVIGTLVWYSVSDAVRLTPDVLREAMEAASLDPVALAPRGPTPEAALPRASEAAQVRMRRLAEDRNGETIQEERYANILVRPADRGVKQMVTEVLDCAEHRLLYQPFATLSLEEGSLKVDSLDNGGALYVEAEALGNLRRYFEFEKEHHDGESARRVVGRVLSAANAIPLRNSGGMYFVPKPSATAEGASKEAGTGELPTHDATASQILAFVEQVRDRSGSAPNKTPRASRAMSVPLVDREEYREIVADSLGEHVEKEAKALVSEMSRLLKSDTAVTERRSRGFVERVKSLKEGVSQYEELLEMRATEARTHLDTAMKQARGLLGRVGSPADDAEGSGP